MGHQPGPGVAVGPPLSATDSKSRNYRALQSQNPPPQALGCPSVPPTSIQGLLVSFPLDAETSPRNLEVLVRFYGVFFVVFCLF